METFGKMVVVSGSGAVFHKKEVVFFCSKGLTKKENVLKNEIC